MPQRPAPPAPTSLRRPTSVRRRRVRTLAAAAAVLLGTAGWVGASDAPPAATGTATLAAGPAAALTGAGAGTGGAAGSAAAVPALATSGPATPGAAGPGAPSAVAAAGTAAGTATSTGTATSESAGTAASAATALPPVADGLARGDVVTGPVVRAVAEAEAEHADDGTAQAGTLTWIRTQDGDSVQVPTSDLAGVADGSVVRARVGDLRGARSAAPADQAEAGRELIGVDVVSAPGGAGGDVPADGVLAGSETSDAATGSATAVNRVTIVMALPPGATRDATTPQALSSLVSGPVAAFWREQSGGAVEFVVARTVGWTTLSTPCSAGAGLWDEAARVVGFTGGAREHLLVYLSASDDLGSSCYAGLGTVGAGAASGGRAYVRGTTTSLVAHELGHNLGLRHSNGLTCPATVADAVLSGSSWASGCVSAGYRDWYDVMGISWTNLGSLNAVQADRLGSLASTRLDASTPLRTRLVPLSSSGGTRALRLVDPTGAVYYVEYRTASGWDSWLTGNSRGLRSGLLVRRPDAGGGSVLLDATPTGSSSDWDAVLPVGQVLRSASGRLQVRLDAADASGATVSVAVDGVWPVVASAPAPVLTTPAAGATVSAGTVTVTGRGAAAEGTLLWEVTRSTGVLVASGWTVAGVDDQPADFSFTTTLAAGDYRVSVWAPDEGEAESGVTPTRTTRAVTVR